MRAPVRVMMALIAVVFVFGSVGCGKKIAVGESCKRHSQCETGVCGSDMTCQSKADDRKNRKEGAKKRGN